MTREYGPQGFCRRNLLAALGSASGSIVLAGCQDTDESDEEGDSDDLDPGLSGGASCPRDRTDDTALPFDSNGEYGGWGGHAYHETDAGLRERPVVFVHGNGRDACDFDEHAAYFAKRGYMGDALWSITFERETATHEEMADQLDSFIVQVREYTDAGRVDLVGHSLGVTGLRYWLSDRERYEWASSLIGLAGANHGTWTCGPGCAAGLGTTRICDFLSHVCADTPGRTLYELNHPEETPESVEYYTIRGTADEFFRTRPESPELNGAENVAIEDADHDEIRTSEKTKELLFEWLSGE